MLLNKVRNPPPVIGCKRKRPPIRHTENASSRIVRDFQDYSHSSQQRMDCATPLPCPPAPVDDAAGSRESFDSTLASDTASTTSVSKTSLRTRSLGSKPSFSKMVSPAELLLKKKIKELQSERWKLRRKLNLARVALTTSGKKRQRDSMNIEDTAQAAKAFLTPLQLSFFSTQMLASRKKSKGLRWSKDMKIFALQLHYKSSTAYEFMRNSFALPSSETLIKFVNASVGRMQPGFSSTMFRLVGCRVKELPLLDRQCSLVLDEISLKCNLTYNKFLDKIVGYTDENQLATHALVFMVRGLRRKWKQAVAFFFTHNTIATSQLSELLKTCINKLRDIGLYVRCVVCDQAATNIAALRQLGYSEGIPSLSFPNVENKVYVIFDVPHLIKNLRNNLMKYNLKFGDGESVARWTDISSFYELDKQHPVRTAPRLTDAHIDVTSTRKMRVRLAAQVLSHSVAAGIKTLVAVKQLNTGAQNTADFVEKIDMLFDLLNSRQRVADKPARCAISNGSNNLIRLEEMKNWAKSLDFIGVRAKSSVKCCWGLQTSVSNILSLTSELLSQGFQYVCTSRFNQDCIENFFAGIRGKNGWNESPSPTQFASAFRNAIVLSSLHSNSSGKNCISDEDFTLLNHVDLVLQFNGTVADAFVNCCDEVTVETCNGTDLVFRVEPFCLSESDNLSSVFSHCSSNINPQQSVLMSGNNILQGVCSDNSSKVTPKDVRTEHSYCVQGAKCHVYRDPSDHTYNTESVGEYEENDLSSITDHSCTNDNDLLWSNVTRKIVNFDLNFDAFILEQFTVVEESLISYLSGWVLRKSAICSKCRLALTKPKRDPSCVDAANDIFTENKKYMNCSSVDLLLPNESLFSAVHAMEAAFRLKFDEFRTKPDVAQSLFNLIYPLCDFSFLFICHPEHALYLSSKITKLYIVMRIFYAIKFINRSLVSRSAAHTNTKGRQCVRRTQNSRKMQKIMHT